MHEKKSSSASDNITLQLDLFESYETCVCEYSCEWKIILQFFTRNKYKEESNRTQPQRNKKIIIKCEFTHV